MINQNIKKLQNNLESVLIGKSECVKLILVGLFAQGHILIEDVPGVGKTTLARAMAKSIDCTFQRIQFTPDLLPSDIIGVSIYHPQSDRFVFKPGPIFANIILADEINRATPRTQSSLLEAMNDTQASVDGVTYKLSKPFMVLATQNPIEFEGTYPLPESQLDRFLMKIRIGYPSTEDEKRVIISQKISPPLDSLSSVLNTQDIIEIQDKVKKVLVDESLVDYLLKISNKTRESEFLKLGVSPRGSLALFRGAQALALVENRDYAIPDDIKKLAVPVLSHRVIGKSLIGSGDDSEAYQIIEDILQEVPVPL